MSGTPRRLSEREIVTCLRAGLEVDSTPEQDVDLWPVPRGTRWIASSIDRAHHGKCPPGEPLDVWAFRAVNAALSDLACAGVEDLTVQIDLQVPRDVGMAELDHIAQGVVRSLRVNSAILLNGCNTTFGPMAMTTAVRGTRQSAAAPPGRSGAGPGDWIWVSRVPGRFNEALDLMNDLLPGRHPRWVGSALLGGLPELELGRSLIASGAVTAMVDANDCLQLCLADLARASAVAVDLDEAALRRIADAHPGRGGVSGLLGPPSGDLALVFTAPERRLQKIHAVFDRLNRRPWLLGRCAPGAGEVLINGAAVSGDSVDLPVRKWRPSAVFRYPIELVDSADPCDPGE